MQQMQQMQQPVAPQDPFTAMRHRAEVNAHHKEWERMHTMQRGRAELAFINEAEIHAKAAAMDMEIMTKAVGRSYEEEIAHAKEKSSDLHDTLNVCSLVDATVAFSRNQNNTGSKDTKIWADARQKAADALSFVKRDSYLMPHMDVQEALSAHSAYVQPGMPMQAGYPAQAYSRTGYPAQAYSAYHSIAT